MDDPIIEEPNVINNDSDLVYHKTELSVLIAEATAEQKVIMLYE